MSELWEAAAPVPESLVAELAASSGLRNQGDVPPTPVMPLVCENWRSVATLPLCEMVVDSTIWMADGVSHSVGLASE